MIFWASQVAQWKRNHLPMRELQVRSLGWKDPLEKKMTTCSGILVRNLTDRGAWLATVRGVAKLEHDLAT